MASILRAATKRLRVSGVFPTSSALLKGRSVFSPQAARSPARYMSYEALVEKACSLSEVLTNACKTSTGNVVITRARAEEIVSVLNSSNKMLTENANSIKDLDARLSKVEMKLSFIVTGGTGLLIGVLMYLVAIPSTIYFVKTDVKVAKGKVDSSEKRITSLEADKLQSARKNEVVITIADAKVVPSAATPSTSPAMASSPTPSPDTAAQVPRLSS